MITDVVILGAGGSSREIAGAIADINRARRQWNLLGFLDDDEAKHGSRVDSIPVLGPIASVSAYPAEVKLIIGIASYRDPLTRKTIADRVNVDRTRYATLVHPTAPPRRDQ